MAIEVPCPRCGKLLRAPDELAGKSGRCPECDNSVPIPLAATGAPAAGGAAPDPYAPARDAPPRDAPPRDAPGYGGERFSHRDQTITFILSWLVGIFGVDRFYMGQIGLGLLKLLTCGGLGIWALIDYILVGMGAMRDVDGLLPRRPVFGQPTRSQGVAFILAAFLGMLGIDRFYLGQIGLGLLKLLTCGGFGIWALIDTVIIGCGGMRDEDGNSLA